MVQIHGSTSDLRESNEGRDVTLAGWVHRRRDHGGLIFLDLRDSAASCRWCSTRRRRPKRTPSRARRAVSTCCRCRGNVAMRRAGTENAELPTGEIEVGAEAIDGAQRREDAAVLHQREVGRSTRRCACATAISTCAASGCTTTSSCAPAWRSSSASFLTSAASSRSKRRSSPTRRRKARATTWCRAASPGNVLRAAAVAAAVQAAADGGRLRPLLPDRALLPRRGPARRPPAGVHADRPRDVASSSRRTCCSSSRSCTRDRARAASRAEYAGAIPSPDL